MWHFSLVVIVVPCENKCHKFVMYKQSTDFAVDTYCKKLCQYNDF
jgi:hypothetical protein